MNNFLRSCGVFTTKKLFLQYLKFRELCYHGRRSHVIFYVFPSSFLHSMEKISQFLIFLSISSYL